MMSVDEFSIANVFPQEPDQTNPNPNPKSNANPTAKKKRLPGNPDPNAQVIALSPTTLMTTSRFICEICNKGFRRDQNLQLHRRGHNLPWKLKQRANKDEIIKKVYVCPEKSCVHHDPTRALGDLTGIKKHFSRKHGEKKWKCEKCSKKYAVQSDWKAHCKTCGTREYKCDCGTLFSRKDSFITHRAFCDALADENTRSVITIAANNLNYRNDNNYQNGTLMNPNFSHGLINLSIPQLGSSFKSDYNTMISGNVNSTLFTPSSTVLFGKENSTMDQTFSTSSLYSDNQTNRSSPSIASMSATALLQKAAQMGSNKSSPTFFSNAYGVMMSSSSSSSSTSNAALADQSRSGKASESSMMGGLDLMQTRDFLGMRGEGGNNIPFLSQELANFASMSSAMEFTRFSSNHH